MTDAVPAAAPARRRRRSGRRYRAAPPVRPPASGAARQPTVALGGRATVTTRTPPHRRGSGPTPRRLRPLRPPAPPRKLLLLAVAAAVLVPLANARWPAAAGPRALTVDLSGPLGEASDWIIDNRDSHPLFLYFFGYISNAVVVSVRAVYLVLLAAGWAGVTAGRRAWSPGGSPASGSPLTRRRPRSPSAGCSACGCRPCRRSR